MSYVAVLIYVYKICAVMQITIAKGMVFIL